MTSDSFNDFLGRLDPKTAGRIKTAREIETVRLPLASIGLTHALGGGIAAGRVAVVYGNTSSGKSLLMLQTIGILQKQGLVCGYGDAEGTYEKEFAERLGVNNDELILTQKKSFGAMTDEIIPWIEGGMDVLVIDSISDLLPEVFVDSDGGVKDFEQMKQIGAHAKSNTAMMNAIHYANEKTAVVLISQTTTKIERMYVKQVPHGGKKIEFSASQTIKLQSSNTDEKQIKGLISRGEKLVEQPIGRHVDVTVEKNKLGRQSTTANYDMYYAGKEIGIDRIGETVDLATNFGVIEKRGAWFDYANETYHGRMKLVDKIKQDSDMFDDLQTKLNVALTDE